MKFKKLIAGIMSAVMLATSFLAVDAGAAGLSKIEPVTLEYVGDYVEWDISLFPDEYESIVFRGQLCVIGDDINYWLSTRKEEHFITMYFPVVSDNYDIMYLFASVEAVKILDYDEKNGLYNFECPFGKEDIEELKKEGLPTVFNKKKENGVFKVEANAYGLYSISIQDLIINGKSYMISAPAKTTLSASAKKNKLTLTWDKVSDAEKYQVYVSTDGGKTYSRYHTYKATATKATYTLTKGNTYKFKVRSYKTVNGKKVYSKWSNVKTVKY